MCSGGTVPSAPQFHRNVMDLVQIHHERPTRLARLYVGARIWTAGCHPAVRGVFQTDRTAYSKRLLFTLPAFALRKRPQSRVTSRTRCSLFLRLGVLVAPGPAEFPARAPATACGLYATAIWNFQSSISSGPRSHCAQNHGYRAAQKPAYIRVATGRWLCPGEPDQSNR